MDECIGKHSLTRRELKNHLPLSLFPPRIQLTDGALKEFLEKTESMSPEDKGHALEADNGISKAHEESAQEGQTEVRQTIPHSLLRFCS